jgi:SAM-dependent methyltransferase
MRVTAVERDAAMCGLAARRLAGYGERLRLLQACASDTGLADAHADFVIARYLFQHLPDPEAVAREALRILRPGGVAAVIDIDVQLLGIVTPAIPVVQAIFARGRSHQADQGGQPFVGRHLWRTLRDAGFQAPRLRAFVYHSDELGKEAFEPLLSADQLLPAHAAGRVSHPEMAVAAAAVRRFLADPEAYVLMLGFMATGRKGNSS